MVGTLSSDESAQQLAGADLALENPFEADLAFAALQAKFSHTAQAARRLSSGPLYFHISYVQAISRKCLILNKEGKANVDNSIYATWCVRGIDLW